MGFAIVANGLALKKIGFTVLVVECSVLGLAIDGLALNKLWDLPLPPKS